MNTNQTLKEELFLDKWDWNIQSNSINISSSFKAIFGYADHELPGTIETWIKLILPEDFKQVQRNINQHIESRGQSPFNSQVRLAHKNGAMYSITLTGKVIEWYKNSPLRMIGQHIINRELFLGNNYVAASEKNAINHTAKPSRVGGWEINLKNNTINWTSISKQMHEVDETYQPKLDTAFAFFDRESRDKIKDALKNAANNGIPFDFEYEMVTAKNRKLWTRIKGKAFLSAGKPVKILGVFEDLDYYRRKKQVEARIDEGQALNNYVESIINVDVMPVEHRYSSLHHKLSEKTPSAVFQYQYFPDGSSKFPYSSRGMHDVYELSQEEIKLNSTKVFERVHHEDINNLKAAIEESYQELTGVEIEYRIVVPVKGVRWLKGILNPQRLEDGSVLWHGYIKDITEAKTKEIERFNMYKLVTKQNYQLINFSYKYLQLMMMNAKN